MSTENNPRIIVQDRNGGEMANFEGNKEESLCTQAQDAGAPVPMSCGVGACRTCVAKVISGIEFIDREAVGPQMIDTEDDEVLTCICGIKEDVRPGAEICIRCENL